MFMCIHTHKRIHMVALYCIKKRGVNISVLRGFSAICFLHTPILTFVYLFKRQIFSAFLNTGVPQNSHDLFQPIKV